MEPSPAPKKREVLVESSWDSASWNYDIPQPGSAILGLGFRSLGFRVYCKDSAARRCYLGVSDLFWGPYNKDPTI